MDKRQISDEMFEHALQAFCREIELHIRMAEVYLDVAEMLANMLANMQASKEE